MKPMIPLELSVARSMDGGDDAALVPFLPYILQDVWEIGTNPRVVTDLVRRHQADHSRLRVLDLGCGKGAVCVRLATELGCRCLGIDALAEFVRSAGERARELGVERLCRFEQGDIRLRVRGLGRFDVIVLGAIGPVLGDYRATLGLLSPHLRREGIVVVDDGWIADDAPVDHPPALRRGELLRQVADAGMRIAEEATFAREQIEEADGRIFLDLERRCRELMIRHPEQKALFEGYIRRQVEENDWLENKITCAVLVIRKAGGTRSAAIVKERRK